jgi:GLPGLI family protein
MKKLFFTILTIVYTNYSFSQQNIKVDYGVSFIKDEKIEKNNRINEIFDNANSGASLSSFTLIATNDYANFYAIDYNGLDQQKWRMTLIMADYESMLFIDKKSALITYNNQEGDFKKNKYLIEKKINDNWIINQNDTLTINGFKCFKATTFEELENSKGLRITNEVVAWFTPQIPFQFGPNGYGNLPGLIMQLTSNRVSFFAKNIIFDNIFEINVLSKGVRIKEDDFMKLLFETSKKNKGIKD